MSKLLCSFVSYDSMSKMTRTLLYFVVLLFIFSHCVDCRSKAESKNLKENSYRGGSSYYASNQQKRSDETNQKNLSASTEKSSGGGLGAWGYVAIILTLICTGMGIYYFTLFYPILCKKERKYDVMELSSM